MVVLGLDISTQTGWHRSTVMDGAFHPLNGGVIHHKWPKDYDRMDRWQKYGEDVQGLLTGGVDLVVIEGYGYANAHSLATLVEIGTVIRMYIRKAGIPYIELPPAVVKKFLTGVGNSKKDVMLMETYKRFGLTLTNDNIADALILSACGVHLLGGRVDLPAANLAVLKPYAINCKKS